MFCKHCGSVIGGHRSHSFWEVQARDIENYSTPQGDTAKEVVREAGTFCSPKCVAAYLEQHYGPEGDFYRSQYHEAGEWGR